jgi:uncharacterized membrane protein (DUF485 family)
MGQNKMPPALAAERSERFKQWLGLLLCSAYALVYAVFVFISVYDVTLMDTLMPFGLNLAAFYGFGIIVFALLLALLYSRACSRSEARAAASKGLSNKTPDTIQAEGDA